MGDGRKGYAAGGPYNAIHVGAAAPELPQEVSVPLNVAQIWIQNPKMQNSESFEIHTFLR